MLEVFNWAHSSSLYFCHTLSTKTVMSNRQAAGWEQNTCLFWGIRKTIMIPSRGGKSSTNVGRCVFYIFLLLAEILPFLVLRALDLHKAFFHSIPRESKILVTHYSRIPPNPRLCSTCIYWVCFKAWTWRKAGGVISRLSTDCELWRLPEESGIERDSSIFALYLVYQRCKMMNDLSTVKNCERWAQHKRELCLLVSQCTAGTSEATAQGRAFCCTPSLWWTLEINHGHRS